MALHTLASAVLTTLLIGHAFPGSPWQTAIARQLSPRAARVARGDADRFTVRVSTWSRSLQSGEVILVTVDSSRPLVRLKGTALSRVVGFWPSGERKQWHGLVGIPLDIRPGTHTVVLEAEADEGNVGTERVSLEIARARLAPRRLVVDARFVHPPASAAERIKTETQTLTSVFANPTPARLWRGTFSMPVPGPATSSFGRLSILNGEPRSRHQGRDFRAAEGEPVHAPNRGRVVLAAQHYFSGNTVVLDHGGGLFSLFAHLSRIAIMMGTEVARGDLLGEAGATGRVTGPHLHWTVRLDGTSVDPLSLAAAVAQLPESQDHQF